MHKVYGKCPYCQKIGGHIISTKTLASCKFCCRTIGIKKEGKIRKLFALGGRRTRTIYHKKTTSNFGQEVAGFWQVDNYQSRR